MKPINQSIFRAYDIRGIVDKDFDEEWVETLGRACGTFFRNKGHQRAVVGHDCRHSSSRYQARMVQGLLDTGIHVTFINMVATPLFYYAVKKLGFHAGVMITASHNPKEFNGFKVWEGKSTVHTHDIQAIYSIMAQGDFIQGDGMATEMDIEPAYLDELASQTTLNRPIKVVVDGGNGSAGLVCAQLLERIGATVIPLYCEPDGSFPNHHPDPTVPENVRDLRKAVLEHGAALGIGLDGDGDRIGVIDEKGEIVYGDKLLAIYARDMLHNHPGATVIGEVKCSHLLFEDIAKHGGKPLMWKTGHSLIKAKMRETGALLAGEMSGHMFFADRFYGFDDALYAAQRLVEILGNKEQSALSTLLADWPVTYNTPEIRMECPEGIKFEVIRKAQTYFRQGFDMNDVDGVRLTFKDGWALLRASNTQPVLVLRFEAESQQRLAEIRKIIETPLQTWIKELSNP
ncbi:phosphomannomutase/phosphoglucomutase [Desulfoplanes formicivorans]|uniref:Phosphomannomutase n=1 Tax=Desulfoplanes formicivorans TaxID=1592317 RepID=A0A194AG23_9BACT|nr:phosphomannomutase/phosphoglucomutase [Desulfoplanes formicivorans]GAU08036.1 phosphomannomutase [Desulfoplanes formicivorans]